MERSLFERGWGALARRAGRVIRGERDAEQPLEMIFPQSKFSSVGPVAISEGYRMRQWQPGDLDHYFQLIARSGMPRISMDYWIDRVLEEGFFVVEHEASKAMVASCMAAHRPSPRHPRGGALGWLAGDPEHAGRNLGASVSAAVTQRLIDAGYKNIYLETHDFRLPAIRIYLNLGWVPLLYGVDMPDRWARICDTLDVPYLSDVWRQGSLSNQHAEGTAHE